MSEEKGSKLSAKKQWRETGEFCGNYGSVITIVEIRLGVNKTYRKRAMASIGRLG